MKKLITLSTLVTALWCVSSYAEIKEKRFDLDGVKKVSITGLGKANFSYGDSNYVIVSADEAIINNVDVTPEFEELCISYQDNNVKIGTINYIIVLENLTELNVSGSVIFKTDLIKNSSEFDVSASGFSSIKIEDLQTSTLLAGISGKSKFFVEKLNVTTLDIHASGDSGVILKDGSIECAKIQLETTSVLKSFSTKIERAIVELNGASKAIVSVEGELKGVLKGASQLHYKGKPETKVHTTGVSSIQSLDS